MDDDFFRKDNSAVMSDPQDRRPLPPVIYNDSDVQTFRLTLSSYMNGDFLTAATEIRNLRARYSDIVHIQLNELIIKFYLNRCVNTVDFQNDLKDAMIKVRYCSIGVCGRLIDLLYGVQNFRARTDF